MTTIDLSELAIACGGAARVATEADTCPTEGMLYALTMQNLRTFGPNGYTPPPANRADDKQWGQDVEQGTRLCYQRKAVPPQQRYPK
jgi:hypothetical protein